MQEEAVPIDRVTDAAVGRPVFISDESARSLLDWPGMIAALRATYTVEHTPAMSPPRVLARSPDGVWMRTLTGLDPFGRFMGVKQFGLSRERKLKYLISLFDQQDGEIVALLDGNGITALRTAATTALAVDRMTPPGAATLGLLGSGAEAFTHARAIHTVRPLERLTVYSPNEERRTAFATAFEAETGVRAVAATCPEQAVRDQAIVVGATRVVNGVAVIQGAWLSPTTMLASIGATLPEHREIDPQTIAQAGIIVADVPEEVIKETGCFRDADVAGVSFADEVVSLNDLMLGRVDDRVDSCGYPLYRSVGGPLQDLAIATLAYDRAVAAGAARVLPIAFSSKT